MIQTLRLAANSLMRDWRAGELRILALSLVVAVAAVTAVAFFTDRIEGAMTDQAAELLAADLVVVSSSPIRHELNARAQAEGLQTATTIDFPSVVLVDEQTLLVQVKAVHPNYPLRGELRISDRPYGQSTPTREVPRSGEVWADVRLLDQFDRAVGMRVGLGDTEFTVSSVLAYEPDRGGQLFRLAPRVLMRLDDVAATGLVSNNSRVRYRLLIAGDSKRLANYRQWLKPHLLPGEELRSVRDGRPELRTALDRAQRYLGLASLVAVLVAGAAIALAARHYAERQMDTSAIMRCLGASQGLIVRVYTFRLIFIGVLASLTGCLIGYLAQLVLTDLFGGWFVDTVPQPSLTPIMTGVSTGLVSIMGFALPPLLRLRHVPPLRVFRRELGSAPPSVWITLASAITALAVLLFWQAGGSALTLRFVLGAIAVVVTLWLLAAVFVALLRWLHLHTSSRWRYGTSRVLQRSNSSVLQIAGFTLGVTAMLVLAIARVDLLTLWHEGLPENAPNHFLINIQHDEKQSMEALFREHQVVTSPYYPLIRGRLVALNGKSISPGDYASLRAQRLLGREFNLTWTDQLRSDNQVKAGRWWGDKGAQTKEFSVESGIAKTLGITLGDSLRYQIAGLELEGKVTSLREVDWDSFNPNFFVIASPGLLSDAPANLITSFYLDSTRKKLLGKLARQFPSVTVIDIQANMQQVRKIMDPAALAVEFVFLFTLFAGVLVMFAALEASQIERRRETALLRAMGASRGQVLTGLLAEFATIGIVVGVLASLVASVTGYLLATQIFDLYYRPNLWLWMWGILGSAAGIGISGILGTRKLLNQSPLIALRRA